MDEQPEDRPDGYGDPRPWEQPGECRRDCEPYDGRLVRVLAWSALGITILGLCLPLLCLVSLALGVVALRLARRDLDRGRGGLLTPEDVKRAHDAARFSMSSVVATVVPLAFW